ncbi:MAG: hypothetical protein ACRDS1_05625 [Pseudonocardiaceae bacterium]
MTGRPSNGRGEPTARVAPSHLELARLRAFCLLNAVLYLCAAALIAFLRLLIANLVDEGRVQVAAPLLAQEMLCAASLVVLAALLLWVRRAISPDQIARERVARVGRTARVLALLISAICAAGMVVVVLLPIADTTLPTALVTGVVIVFAFYTYAGMAKLTH